MLRLALHAKKYLLFITVEFYFLISMKLAKKLMLFLIFISIYDSSKVGIILNIFNLHQIDLHFQLLLKS
jgi:hypothetical protein